MKAINDCFLKVKKDYLKFLAREKIFNKSEQMKIVSLRRNYIPYVILDRKKI